MLCRDTLRSGRTAGQRTYQVPESFPAACEEQKVKFTIDRKELAFYGADMELIDGGIPLRITVGNSSRAEAGDVSLQLDRRS